MGLKWLKPVWPPARPFLGFSSPHSFCAAVFSTPFPPTFDKASSFYGARILASLEPKGWPANKRGTCVGTETFSGIFYGPEDAGWEPAGTPELSYKGELLILTCFLPCWAHLQPPLYFTPKCSSQKKRGRDFGSDVSV